jgi:hypothetical protein
MYLPFTSRRFIHEAIVTEDPDMSCQDSLIDFAWPSSIRPMAQPKLIGRAIRLCILLDLPGREIILVVVRTGSRALRRRR